MIFFKWHDSFNIGIAKVDEQHRQLVELVNSFYSAMYEGEGQKTVGETLAKLARYTQNHFSYEEKQMIIYGYPGYIEHKKIHEKMSAKVLQLLQQFEQGKIYNPVQMANFLKNWLSKHILGTDIKFGKFYQRKINDQV